MKKRELMKRLRSIAAAEGGEMHFVRQGANHEIWRVAGEMLVIPRHREINERTAAAILDAAHEALGDQP